MRPSRIEHDWSKVLGLLFDLKTTRRQAIVGVRKVAAACAGLASTAQCSALSRRGQSRLLRSELVPIPGQNDPGFAIWIDDPQSDDPEPVRLVLTDGTMYGVLDPSDATSSGVVLKVRPADIEIEGWWPSGQEWLYLVLSDPNGRLFDLAFDLVNADDVDETLVATLQRRLTPPLQASPVPVVSEAARSLPDAEEFAIKQHLAAQVRENRGSQPGPIDQKTVDFIAWNLLLRKIQPTQEAIREVAGGGSPNALYPKLRQFFGALPAFIAEHAGRSTDEVPAGLVQVFKELTQLAHAEAAVRLAPEQAKIDDEHARLAEDRDLLTAEQAAWNQAQVQAASAAAERDRHVTHLEAEVARMNSALTQAQNTIVGDGQLLSEVRADLRNERVRSAELASRVETLRGIEQDLKDNGERLIRELVSLAKARDTVAMEYQSNLASWTSERDGLKAAATTLSADLAAALATVTAGVAERERLAVDLREQISARADDNAQLAMLRADVDRLRPAAISALDLQGKVIALQAELGAVKGERDRLVQASSAGEKSQGS